MKKTFLTLITLNTLFTSISFSQARENRKFRGAPIIAAFIDGDCSSSAILIPVGLEKINCGDLTYRFINSVKVPGIKGCLKIYAYDSKSMCKLYNPQHK